MTPQPNMSDNRFLEDCKHENGDKDKLSYLFWSLDIIPKFRFQQAHIVQSMIMSVLSQRIRWLIL